MRPDPPLAAPGNPRLPSCPCPCPLVGGGKGVGEGRGALGLCCQVVACLPVLGRTLGSRHLSRHLSIHH